MRIQLLARKLKDNHTNHIPFLFFFSLPLMLLMDSWLQAGLEKQNKCNLASRHEQYFMSKKM